MRILPLLLPVALMLPASLTAQKINDVVLKKDGARVRGLEITDFLLSGVRGKRGADDFELPAHMVKDIEWSELPEEFVAGKGAMGRGDFAAASQFFGAVQSERALVKADAEFFKVKAAIAGIGADQASAATAAGHMKGWLGSNLNHWRTPEALLLQGRAERLAGKAAEATATLKDLDDRAIRDGFGTIWSARAKYELALTLVADGKSGEARTAFKSASSAANTALNTSDTDKSELQNLKTLSRVGEGETYLIDKDFKKAESFFKSLANDPSPALKAAAAAGEGEAIFQSALASKNANDLRRAQLALAKASVFDSTSGEASAKANYYLGRCLLALGAEKEGDSFKQRALKYFEIVYTAYPSTRWAGLAKSESQK
ncbi:MAG: hypothetical protein VYD05_12510 [Planctomycetota bacterium]|nr:hypothetical protein [Planctomycetota bacterium]MEC9048682.1 hypothetical protein [Planctomycetota bacterium]